MNRIKRIVNSILPTYAIILFVISVLSAVAFFIPTVRQRNEKSIVYDLCIIFFLIINCVLIPLLKKRLFRIFLDIAAVLFVAVTCSHTAWVWVIMIVASVLSVLIVYRKTLKKSLLRIIAVTIALTQIFIVNTLIYLFLIGIPFPVFSCRIVEGPEEKNGLIVEEIYDDITGKKIETNFSSGRQGTVLCLNGLD